MSEFVNVNMTPRLKTLHAQVLVWFRDAVTAEEADIRSEYETEKRPTILDVTMPGGGESASMEYAIATLNARVSDVSDGTMPVYTPGAASVSNKAAPQGFIVRIHHSDLRDDRYGILQSSVNGVATEAVRWKYNTIAIQITDGLTKKTVDDLSYFNAAHYVNLRDAARGTFTNSLALALTADNFAAARTKFRQIPRDNGLPYHDNAPDVLIVSAANETNAENIVANPTLFGGAANPNYRKCKIIVVPEWDTYNSGAYANAWVLAKTRSTNVKPFIWNEREALNITYIGAKTSGPLPGLYHEWMVYGEMALAFYDPRLALWSMPA